MGRREIYIQFWGQTLKERDHLEDVGADGENVKINLQEIGLEGSCECVDEYSAYIKCGEFLE